MVHKILVNLNFPPFKHGERLNIPCNKTFDICEIKRMTAPFITLGYVNI